MTSPYLNTSVALERAEVPQEAFIAALRLGGEGREEKK